MVKHTARHPGFQVIAQRIANRMNVPIGQAQRILGAANAKYRRSHLLRNPRWGKLPLNTHLFNTGHHKSHKPKANVVHRRRPRRRHH